MVLSSPSETICCGHCDMRPSRYTIEPLYQRRRSQYKTVLMVVAGLQCTHCQNGVSVTSINCLFPCCIFSFSCHMIWETSDSNESIFHNVAPASNANCCCANLVRRWGRCRSTCVTFACELLDEEWTGPLTLTASPSWNDHFEKDNPWHGFGIGKVGIFVYFTAETRRTAKWIWN